MIRLCSIFLMRLAPPLSGFIRILCRFRGIAMKIALGVRLSSVVFGKEAQVHLAYYFDWGEY